MTVLAIWYSLSTLLSPLLVRVRVANAHVPAAL